MQFSRSSRLNHHNHPNPTTAPEQNKNVNPFISGSNAFINKSAKSPNNIFDTASSAQREKKEENEKKEAVEDFPALTALTSTRQAAAAAATTAATTSYKDLLVSTIDRRMIEEQLKMRSAQAAELERGSEYYSKALLSDARAARAASNAVAETDLELLYDEDGCERR